MEGDEEINQITGAFTEIKYKREVSKNPKTELSVKVVFTDDKTEEALEKIKSISMKLIREEPGEPQVF